MGQISARLRKIEGGYAHWCPACNEMHPIAVETPQRNGARWSFDGNVTDPTFAPSINISVGPFPDGHVERCHYHIKAGAIEFCGDCTHAMAGQAVPLPPLPKGLTDE